MDDMNPMDADDKRLTVGRPYEGDGHDAYLDQHGSQFADEQVHDGCDAEWKQAVAQHTHRLEEGSEVTWAYMLPPSSYPLTATMAAPAHTTTKMISNTRPPLSVSAV